MESREKIKINILTRSSGRPIGFHQCYSSIKEQTYKNINHIVSFDNKQDLQYLKDLDLKLIEVDPISAKNFSPFDKEGNRFFPYNLYLNTLLRAVEDGWILFLDDDDHLYNNKVIEEIVEQIKTHNEETLFIWQMRYPNGIILPSNELIKRKEIIINNISSCCFLFHSKYNKILWDPYKRADYRFVKQLSKIIPNKVFLRKIGIQVNNFGGYGKRNDILVKKSKNLPSNFYSNNFTDWLPKYHTSILGIRIFNRYTYTSLGIKIINIIKLLFYDKNG